MPRPPRHRPYPPSLYRRPSAASTFVVRLWGAWALSLVLWLCARPVQAQLLGPDALPGGRHVPSAAPAEPRAAALATVEYGHTEPLATRDNSHERLTGTVAAAYTARRWLAFSAEFLARYDLHHGGADSDQGLATSTRVATRHAFDLAPRTSLALALSALFPGADDLGRGFKAITPEFSLVGTQGLWAQGELSLQAGYRLDRTRHALAAPFALSADDRLSAQLSEHDAALVGALLSGRTGALSWAAEWSWDVAVGSGAPGPLSSPMRVELGLQTRLRERVVLGGHLGASPSTRPELERLVRIEPRFWLGLSCGVVLGQERAPVRKPRPVASTPEVVRSHRVMLLVVDPSGAPVSGAQVQAPGESPRFVDSAGRMAFDGPEGSTQRVQVSAEGHQPQEAELEFQADAMVTVTLERALPAGEIKGSVRSLRGGPLVATITVVELESSVTSGTDGSFRVDVPPGSYTLRISAPGHESQERTVRVEQLGVAILVVDLRKSH